MNKNNLNQFSKISIIIDYFSYAKSLIPNCYNVSLIPEVCAWLLNIRKRKQQLLDKKLFFNNSLYEYEYYNIFKKGCQSNKISIELKTKNKPLIQNNKKEKIFNQNKIIIKILKTKKCLRIIQLLKDVYIKYKNLVYTFLFILINLLKNILLIFKKMKILNIFIQSIRLNKKMKNKNIRNCYYNLFNCSLKKIFFNNF